ncbi:sll0787 family AIR synthase-like protein [Leptolyngbya sp. FACHB-711]|uniref:sll0787 family AIR synthase-like protein n=1 Tax=Leptolyngbya sp. FACHB-711 TaxID=2692813 RepID=UPI00168595EE|nr:sll0787 family AIR synthase-like protein [Leptolyngbya sp. FACHB-711]MBD2023425.1 sll0787 family AIR synthase-like protein [Leptolyngbya sp. FACHB-711]
MLSTLVTKLQESIGVLHKQDIQTAAHFLRQTPNWLDAEVLLGDDCAAIPDGEAYLLLASEGMMPFFVEQDPWFAGWSAVMVNVSDIYAMGGRPIALVDALWSQSVEQSQQIWAGMQAAAQAYDVPIVGGHTNCHSPYNALSVSILGRAERLMTSFDAQPGQQLLMAVNFDGQMHPEFAFWNAATKADPVRLQEDLALLPDLAEKRLCRAGKDISMGGVIGTTLMLLETSACGAVLNLDAIPCPAGVSLDQWLTAFPSYGFLLSIDSDHVATVQAMFRDRQLICEPIGEVNCTSELVLRLQQDSICFWNLQKQSLTGFTPAVPA